LCNNRSINQSINQSNNQTINQSIGGHQSLDLLFHNKLEHNLASANEIKAINQSNDQPIQSTANNRDHLVK